MPFEKRFTPPATGRGLLATLATALLVALSLTLGGVAVHTAPTEEEEPSLIEAFLENEAVLAFLALDE
ncbi:MAG: hypothetical protein IKC73_05620 [Clostridia bacterium]|nr:hypothetical protein [Clostridia bacterium]